MKKKTDRSNKKQTEGTKKTDRRNKKTDRSNKKQIEATKSTTLDFKLS